MMRETVEIIRCKDCAYFQKDVSIGSLKFDICKAWNDKNGALTSEDGYCHKAKKRDA